MGMYKKLLISTSLLACVLGAGVVSSVAADAQYIQQANIAGYNTRKTNVDLEYPTVIDSTTHEVKPRDKYTGVINNAHWTFGKVETDPDTGENSLIVTVDPSEFIGVDSNEIDKLFFNWSYSKNGASTTSSSRFVEEIMKGGENYWTATEADKFYPFSSYLAILKNDDKTYYGNVGYIDQHGNFVPCPIYSMYYLDDGTTFDIDGDQKIAFRFENIDFSETTNAEIGVVDGMMNMELPGIDQVDGQQREFNQMLGGRENLYGDSGFKTWEEYISWTNSNDYNHQPVEFISLTGPSNGTVNNQTLEVDAQYNDPIISESFEISNVQHNSAEITFDAYTSTVQYQYQEFDQGVIGDVNKNIDFYYGDSNSHIDAKLLSVEDNTKGTNDIRTYDYELTLPSDSIIRDMSVDITFENADGILNSMEQEIPKTRTYEVLDETEQIVTRYDNPFDLSSSTTVWNDDKGQIAAHIALNKGEQYLPLDPSTQSIKFKYYNAENGTTGIFNDGINNKYNVKFTVSADGTYADLIITNPYGNEFVSMTDLIVSIDTQKDNIENEVYEYTLKTYPSSDSIGTTTPINSIVDSEITGNNITLTFDVDPVNNSTVDTETALENLNLTFGFDSVYTDDQMLIDADAQPIYPETGTAFTTDNDFVVTKDAEDNYLASIVLTVPEDKVTTIYTDFWMQTEGVFRIYDKSGTTVSDTRVNPIIANSGEVTNVTGTTATLSFLVNDDGEEDKYANYVADSAKFTSSSNVDGVTAAYVDTQPESLLSGQMRITYDIAGLKQGQSYNNIAVEFTNYSDEFVSDGPRQILNTFKTDKENPVVENSATIISKTDTTARVSFDVKNEIGDGDQYGDFNYRTAIFDATGFVGDEDSRYISQVAGSTETTLTYEISNLNPNTDYSGLTVDFKYTDDYISTPTMILNDTFTTSRTNPIIEGSGKIIDKGSDYVEISFNAYYNPSTGHEDYANYDESTAVFTGNGLTGSETVSVIGSPGILGGNIHELKYRISGLNPSQTYSNIYVNFTFEEFEDEPTLIIGSSFVTDKLNPIIQNSGEVTNITENSATISFDINEDGFGKDIYADVIPKSADFKYDGQTNIEESTETATYVSKVDHLDNTSTITYNLTGLSPNKEYSNITVSMDYNDTFVEDGPTLIYDSFTTKRMNPIIEKSGKVTTVTETDATISFNVHEDISGEDIYADYDTDVVTMYYDSTVEGEPKETWTDNITFISSSSNGDNTTKLTYKISDLTPNHPYTNIDVELGYAGGETYEPTHILNVITTDNISKDPIVETSFIQNEENTTINSVEFSFEYRTEYLAEDAEITNIGYKDESNNYVEFTNFEDRGQEPDLDGERGVWTFRLNELETNKSYDNIWIQLDGGEKVFAIDQSTGNEFNVRTKGLEPIIENSAVISEVTDTTAHITYDYYSNTRNSIHDKDGNYYEFDTEDVTIGYMESDGTTTVEVPFLSVDHITDRYVSTDENGVITKKAEYDITNLSPATSYESIYVKAHTNDSYERIELEKTIISADGFETLGQNPILSDSIEIANVVPSDGTEAEMSFWFQGVSSMYDEGEYLYSQIDTSKTLVGYDSSVQTESDGTKIGKDDGGVFDSEHMGDETINGIFTKATYKITGLDANTTYTGIYVIVYDAGGHQLSKTYATGDNATFTALPSDALPMTPGEVIMWISIIVLVVLLLIIIIYIAIKYIKKHFALAIFMDAELSVDESEIVFNLINAKHKKKLWQAFEGNLVLYAAGKKIDAIFKRTTELHNGYRIYISEDFTDKEAIFSLLTSTKYNKFSVGIYKDHSRYHVTSVPDHKVAKLASRLDHTDDREYEDVVHSIVENLDDGHIEERLFDSIEGFISGINKRKTTSTSLRYQAIVPHDHSLNHDLFFEENDVSFWHVYDGKLYELKYEFKNRFGSLIEVDIVGLKPGTAYVGLTLSFDKGKTFMPSATVYGITRDEDGKMPNLTNAELAKKPSASAKGVQIWDEQTLVANVGERLAELHKKVITKMHFEDNEENSTKIISLEKSTSYFGDYINKWWSESKVEKPKTSSKTTETKVSTKEEPKAKKEESKTKKDDSKAK